jgi:hypothetical protein
MVEVLNRLHAAGFVDAALRGTEVYLTGHRGDLLFVSEMETATSSVAHAATRLRVFAVERARWSPKSETGDVETQNAAGARRA